MKRLLCAIGGALLLAFAAFAAPASATTCSAFPYTLTDGTTADASQVMADFNNLLNCLNLDVAPLASPTFTGTATIPTLNVTGASTLTGAVSAPGGVTGNLTGAVTGNASTASQWATTRTESLNGDVSGSASVNGSGNWTVTATIGAGAVTGAKIAPSTVTNSNLNTMGGLTIKGNAIGSATNPQDLSAAQALGLLAQQSPNCCNPGVAELPMANVNPFYLVWGLYDCGSSTCWNTGSATSVSWTPTCPNGALMAQATAYNPGNISSPRTPTILSVSSGSLSVRGDGASDEGFYWFVICH
jgi:hypothetical protein